MATTEPLMQKIAQLRSTPGKEVTRIQLIRTFKEHRVQPLAARAHCMWDYSGRKDPTQLSSDEMKDIDMDDGVRTISVLTKKPMCQRNLGLSLSARPTLELRYMFSLNIPCLLELAHVFVAALESN
jgi:hypothetical protein